MTRLTELLVESTADLASARRRAAEVATFWLGADRAEDVALVVSELLTNALEHGVDVPVVLSISADDDAFSVEVGSRSDGLPAPPPDPAPVTQVRGRGLRIASSLSDNVIVTGAQGRVGVTARFNRS